MTDSGARFEPPSNLFCHSDQAPSNLHIRESILSEMAAPMPRRQTMV
jgi:hypothetical protein